MSKFVLFLNGAVNGSMLFGVLLVLVGCMNIFGEMNTGAGKASMFHCVLFGLVGSFVFGILYSWFLIDLIKLIKNIIKVY